MALTSVDGQLNAEDVRSEPIRFGTVGGGHIINRSAAGRTVNAVIDDMDPRVQYGAVDPATFPSEPLGFQIGGAVSTQLSSGGTLSVIGGTVTNGVPGSAVQLYFEGTSIALMGTTNSTSGKYRVFIDNVETPGRLPVSATLQPPSGFDTSNFHYFPAIDYNTTTFQLIGGITGFPASGTIIIGSELMTYTSITGSTLNGVTRGVNGTTAVPHYDYETVYLWDSSLDLSGMANSAFTEREYLYYNPLLQPGHHKITVVVETGSNTYARLYVDGFVIGSGGLVGSKNLALRYGTFTIAGATTDANGHVDLGYPVSRSNDYSVVSILGYSQDSAETSNTVAMGSLGLRWNPTGNGPLLYYHNGPPSATFTLYLHFAYIGNSL
jgi:hypothetical protein